MRFAIFLLFLLITPAIAKVYKDPVKVALVDTGLDLNDPRLKDHLCLTGHKDFTGDGLRDTNGHGTHLAGLIQQYAGEGNYCLLIYKYYSSNADGYTNLTNEIRSFREAIKNGATLINLSGGGPSFSRQEYNVIHDNQKVTFIVAAGNEGENIETQEGGFYPASFFLKNEIIVGNLDKDGYRAPSSNWAYNQISWEIGQNVLSDLPDDTMGRMSGTSQATAIHTGKILKRILHGTN